MAHTYDPKNFIPIADAFAQALSAIKGGPPSLGKVFTDDELRDYFKKYDEFVQQADKLMREALAEKHLHVFIKAQNGEIERLICDPNEWRRKYFGVFGKAQNGEIERVIFESFYVSDIENVSHHLTSPGPDTSGQPMLLSKRDFQDWLTSQQHSIDPFRTGGPGKPSAIRIVETEHVRRLASGGVLEKVGEEAAYLKEWLDKMYSNAPNTTKKTIENLIRDAHRKRTVTGKGS